MNEGEILKLAKEADKDDMPGAAVELFSRLWASGVDRGSIKFRLAENLRQLGRLNECETVLNSIEEVPPQKRWLFALSWGQLYMEKGHFARAEMKFRESVQRNPGSTIPWIYLASSLAKQERIQEAFKELTKALNAKGDLDEVYFNLGLFMRYLRDYAAARDLLKNALAITPDYEGAQTALRDVEFCLRHSAQQ